MLKNLNEYEKGRTIVYFVRHGERIHIPNSPNSGLLIPGPGLTSKGKKQAIEVAKELYKDEPLPPVVIKDYLHCVDGTFTKEF